MASLIFPTAGSVISYFGAARDGGARSHEGIDIGAPTGTPVIAAAAGRVTHAGWLTGTAGNAVKIDHGGGWQSKYFHLSRWHVSVGQQVSAGQIIGEVGQTGNARTTPPHLHFEVWSGGRAVDPLTVLQGSAVATVGGVSIDKGKLILALLVFVLLTRI